MNRTKTTTIVLHHSVTDQQNDQVKTMGIIKGSHSGVSPYHVVIGKDWIYTDPSQLEIKFHAGNYPVNLESVAVCMVGNFVNDTLTAYQNEQLKKTLNQWMQKYSIIRQGIKLHREVRLQPTACPGKLDQNFISLLLTPSMTCEQELSTAKAEVVKLNTEIGTTTAQRDTALRDLTKEKLEHAEDIKIKDQNYQNWQTALDRYKRAEEKLYKIEGILEG